MTLTYRLYPGSFEDWYVLHFFDSSGELRDGSLVEGDKQEWEECAEAIRLGESYSAKRLSAKFTKDGALEFHSPRNASGRGDYYRISKNCAESLSKHIFEVIHEL